MHLRKQKKHKRTSPPSLPPWRSFDDSILVLEIEPNAAAEARKRKLMAAFLCKGKVEYVCTYNVLPLLTSSPSHALSPSTRLIYHHPSHKSYVIKPKTRAHQLTAPRIRCCCCHWKWWAANQPPANRRRTRQFGVIVKDLQTPAAATWSLIRSVVSHP